MLPKHPDHDSNSANLADFIRFAHLPVQERIADRLADVLFGVDEVVAMLGEPGASSIRSIEPDVKRIFDAVDRLIRKVSD